jgi:crotonobetainyl-CoA:carnitine CoA-transferase CaiB-like acyl-CoA transferase
VIGLGFRWTGEPDGELSPAPRLGEHTDAVLREAGIAPDAIAHLRQVGAVA